RPEIRARVDGHVGGRLAEPFGLRRDLPFIAECVKSPHPVGPGMLHGFANKSGDILRQQKPNRRAAFQAFLSEEDVRSASAAANGEIFAADFPLCEALRDFATHSLRLLLWEARCLPIWLIDHVTAANRN